MILTPEQEAALIKTRELLAAYDKGVAVGKKLGWDAALTVAAQICREIADGHKDAADYDRMWTANKCALLIEAARTESMKGKE